MCLAVCPKDVTALPVDLNLVLFLCSMCLQCGQSFLCHLCAVISKHYARDMAQPAAHGGRKHVVGLVLQSFNRINTLCLYFLGRSPARNATLSSRSVALHRHFYRYIESQSRSGVAIAIPSLCPCGIALHIAPHILLIPAACYVAVCKADLA